MIMPSSSISRIRLAAVALIAVIAGVHFEQYVDFINEVPKVGVLFLLNAAGAAAIAFALISQERLIRLGAAVGAVGLAGGSLISIIIALSGNFLGYSEPTLRLPIVIAIVAEALVIPLLLGLARTDASSDAPVVASASSN
jgi:hypothetical protein